MSYWLRLLNIVLLMGLTCIVSPGARAASSLATCHVANTSEVRTTLRLIGFLKAVPPHATLDQIKKLLPSTTKYEKVEQTANGVWTWNIIKFSGPLHGELVFANTRNTGANSPASPQSGGLRPSDPIHYIEAFLGAVREGNQKTLRADSYHYLKSLTRYLGSPQRKEWTGDGEGLGEDGWTADWHFKHARHTTRTLWFMITRPLMDSEERPLLVLQFPYSHLYRE